MRFFLLTPLLVTTLHLVAAAQVFLLKAPNNGRRYSSPQLNGTTAGLGPWHEAYNLTVRHCDDIGWGCSWDRWRDWKRTWPFRKRYEEDHVFRIPAKTNVTLMVSGLTSNSSKSEWASPELDYNYEFFFDVAHPPVILSWTWTLFHNIPKGSQLQLTAIDPRKNSRIPGTETVVLRSRTPARSALKRRSTTLSLGAPERLVSCSTAIFKLRGRGAPFFLEIRDQKTMFMLSSFANLQPGDFEWLVNLPAGTKLKYTLSNTSGWIENSITVNALSPAVEEGDTMNCSFQSISL